MEKSEEWKNWFAEHEILAIAAQSRFTAGGRGLRRIAAVAGQLQLPFGPSCMQTWASI